MKRGLRLAGGLIVVVAAQRLWLGCGEDRTGVCDSCGGADAAAPDAPSGEVATFTIELSGHAQGGAVISQPAGIDCGTSCTAEFPTDGQVTLTAQPFVGDFQFSGWMGACLGNQPCTLSAEFPRHVIAYFGAGCNEADKHSDLAWIQDNIFAPSCALSGCHAGSAGGLTLTAGMAESELVGVPSQRFPNLVRVVPGSPETSHLMTMLGANAGPLSGSMPPNDFALCAEKLAAIERWILSLP